MAGDKRHYSMDEVKGIADEADRRMVKQLRFHNLDIKGFNSSVYSKKLPSGSLKLTATVKKESNIKQ
jgi:hypothetical protein